MAPTLKNHRGRTDRINPAHGHPRQNQHLVRCLRDNLFNLLLLNTFTDSCWRWWPIYVFFSLQPLSSMRCFKATIVLPGKYWNFSSFWHPSWVNISPAVTFKHFWFKGTFTNSCYKKDNSSRTCRSQNDYGSAKMCETYHDFFQEVSFSAPFLLLPYLPPATHHC